MTDGKNNTATTKIEITDDIRKNLNQVHSMLLLIWGGGLDNFDECSSSVRDYFLWACSDSVERALAGMDELQGISKSNKEVKHHG